MDDLKGETAPALGISVEAQYSTGRKVVFQSHVDQATSAEDISKLLDKVNGVVDRQEAYYAIDQAQRQLEVEENALFNFAQRLNDIEGNIQIKMTAEGRRNPKVTAQDEIQKKQALDTLEHGKKRVEIAKKFLEELKQKAGNRDGAPSPANS